MKQDALKTPPNPKWEPLPPFQAISETLTSNPTDTTEELKR